MSESAAVNIASHLSAMARERPHTLAVVQPHRWDRAGRPRYRHATFAELDRDSDLLAAGLRRAGIGRGVRTVLMVPPGLEFYALTFALFKAGAVAVLIDPGMGVRNLGACLKEAELEAFVGVPKAHAARLAFGWGRGTVRTCVTVGPRLGWGGHSPASLRRLGRTAGGDAEAAAPTHAEEIAAVLFTSGSTGVAKGAVYTHGIFAAQVEALRRTYDIRPGEVDLPTFPLFGLFGPALGMTEIIPEMDPTRPADVDPVKILRAVNYFGVTNLFGSPALVRRVGAYGAGRGARLPTLRRVISAGAPVPAAAVERFARMLSPGVQIHTPYGATEALPVSTIGSDEILGDTRHRTAQGAGVCVGRPAEGMHVRVIRISDEPVPTWSDDLEAAPGEVGEVVVRGPVVTRTYYNRPESTALAKISDPAGGFYHRMGDLGYLDERGRLWFCGRKSQRVVTPAGTLFTVPCEGVFNAHPAVARTALVGVPRGGAVEPVLCVELNGENARPADPEAVRKELLELGTARPHTEPIRTVLFHPRFPVDIRHNAKIFREKLAAWAAGRLR
jgi:acyl-CoA synthetase (AMP-forming)/AMP-acid ligase II